MTTDQLERIKKAAESEYGTHPNLYGGQRDGFKKAAQTILENPEEWGLFTPDQMRGQRKHNHVETWYESHIQKEKYREALESLERFTSDNPDYEFINHRLKEALKTGGKQ